MDRLIASLPTILHAAGDSAEVVEAASMAAWKHVVGEGLLDHAAPMRLNQKTLIVAVADATWQKQMQSLSSELLFRLNKVLGQQLVTRLEFLVDPVALAKLRPAQDARRAAEEVGYESVPVELLSAAAQIQDKELRRAFLGAAMSCIRRIEKSEI